jgi:hypothetical protein
MLPKSLWEQEYQKSLTRKPKSGAMKTFILIIYEKVEQELLAISEFTPGF